MEQAKLSMLKEKARDIRLGALEAVYSASSGHPGGSLSIADILAYLYFEEMNIDPANPKDENRDRFVLSKGHTAPALYATLALRGYFSCDMLKTLRQADSFLQGHPDMKHTPGVDMTTGSLGLGISAACGMALSAKIYDKSYRVYTILGDGELEEGQVWEASMFAAHYKLDNLCAFIDFNGLQIDGKITDVMNPTPIDKKFEAFGFNAIRVDGQNMKELNDAIEAAIKNHQDGGDKPTAIIMDTFKGAGVDFMEDDYHWHYGSLDDELKAKAYASLDNYYKKRVERAEKEA